MTLGLWGPDKVGGPAALIADDHPSSYEVRLAETTGICLTKARFQWGAADREEWRCFQSQPAGASN
jgi:hypothetical protein